MRKKRRTDFLFSSMEITGVCEMNYLIRKANTNNIRRQDTVAKSSN